MEPQTTRGADRWTFLIGGVAAVLGSLLGMAGNLIHPATPINDAVGVAQTIAENDGWLIIHMDIVVGIILMLGGMVAIVYSLRGDLAVALGRFALAAAVAGVAIGLILVILDGVAARQLAEEWALAPPDESFVALRLAAMNETMNFALASLFNILFAGVAFILLGFGVTASDGYPRWFGLVAVLAGFESIVAGLIQAESGSPVETARVMTIIGPTLITFWLLVMGILLIRKARRLEQAAVHGTPAHGAPAAAS
jgi:hypothetical protein